jgi:acyl carrier protein
MNQVVESAPLSRQDLEEWLTNEIASLTGLALDQIDPALPIADFDLDSSVVVSLTQALAARLSVDLPVTTLWEYPNIESLSAALAPEADAGVPA